MAPIFDMHHPWVITFGILGNIISIFVYFAPLPTFIQIYKTKSTLGFHSVPYVVALFSAMLWMYYAFLKTNALLLISVNSFGCVIETIYIIVFLIYASKGIRKHTAKLVAGLNVGCFGAILLFTFFLVKEANRLQVVGWICVAIAVSVFAAPLSILFQVVRTKSVEFMPFNLSLFLTLTAVTWFTYGMLLKDLCIAIPNVFGFFLGVIQMVLYAVYRKAAKKAAIKDEKGTVPEHVINVAMVGTNSIEVHPVDNSQSSSSVSDDDEDEEGKEKKKKKQENGGDDSEDEEKQTAKERVDLAGAGVVPKPNECAVATPLPMVVCEA